MSSDTIFDYDALKRMGVEEVKWKTAAKSRFHERLDEAAEACYRYASLCYTQSEREAAFLLYDDLLRMKVQFGKL